MKTGFANYHPFSQLLFFISVISSTMLIMNPVILVISMLISAIYTAYSCGIKDFIKSLRFTLITSLMIIIINPLISHQGITVITELPDGNSLTLESILFGVSAAVMMSSSIRWFFCVNRIFTSDKVIYLFGKISPRLALLISMTLSFVSKFSRQMKAVRMAQFSLGKDILAGRMSDRVKNGIKILSTMIQWSLENSIDTADSMSSRGYGLKKRTSFSIYRICFRDMILISAIIVADVYIIIGNRKEALDYSYYPYFEVPLPDLYSFSVYTVFMLLCVIPLYIDIREDGRWKYIRSKI